MEKEKYVDCPEAEKIAARLVEKFGLDDAKEANIKFLKRLTETSPYLGKCSRATGKWAYLTGYDYVIEVWEPWWEQADDREREALIYHELLHIVRRRTRSGKLRWALRKHDVEEFTEVARAYGAWTPSLKEFYKGLDSYERRRDSADAD